MIASRTRLPNRRPHEVFSFEHEGRRYTATVSRFPDGRPAELFLDGAKFGSDVQVNANTSAILVSLLLQHNVSVNTIRNAVKGPVSVALALAGGANG